MLGAAEHILVEGNEKLILCERGVSAPHTHKDTSRFMLDVQAIVALKEITRISNYFRSISRIILGTMGSTFGLFINCGRL